MIMINGENLPNTFFVVGGVLTSILVLRQIENEKLKLNSRIFMIKVILYRYVRFVPVMIGFLFLNSTWMYRLGSGPFWDKLNYSERQFCRKNWWINLLFMNNYLSGDEKVCLSINKTQKYTFILIVLFGLHFQCLVHSWFLSTDFHLSIIGIGILLLIVKYPARKFLIFGTALTITFLISTIHVYIRDIEPVFIIVPE